MHTVLTVAVADERVEEEKGDPRRDDQRGGEAVQPPLPPGGRTDALLLRRRRSPPLHKVSPRFLHSSCLTSAPEPHHGTPRPAVRLSAPQFTSRQDLTTAVSGGNQRGSGQGASETGTGPRGGGASWRGRVGAI